MTTYTHLTPEERATMMLMLDAKVSKTRIARKLCRDRCTIYRELSRNGDSKSQSYDASKAGQAYRERRKKSVKPKKFIPDNKLWKYIEPWLVKEKWSPQQISNRLKVLFPSDPTMQVSSETIYAHIYARPKGELKKLMVHSLRRRKSKRGPRGSKTTNYSSLKIDEDQLFMNRPKDIDTREIAGRRRV